MLKFHLKAIILNYNLSKLVKFNNLRAFQKHLEGAAPLHFSDIYMILAKEEFDRKTALDFLIKIVLKKEKTPDLCLQVIDADKHSVDVVLCELEMLAFFAKKRLIILHNADQFDKAATLKLEAYFASPNRASCLVLMAPAINRATTFYKNAEKAGVILDIAEEKPWEKEKTLADWLREATSAEGKQIDQNTCRLLVKQLGTDQSLLQQELLKLVCFVGQRTTINERDVAAVCGSINNETGWQLGEAIFRRDSAALRISKALLNDGVAVIALLRQIRSQFQTELNIGTILVQGGGAEEITREYSYMRGQILERHIQNARNYGMAALKEGILKIDYTEFQAKNSSVDPEFLTEVLIMKLISAS